MNNEYDKHIELLKKFNIKGEYPVVIPESKIYNSGSIEKEIIDIIKDNGYISLSPFTSDPDRSYGISNFISICNNLKEHYSIIILGNRRERELAEKISSTSNKIYNFAGKISLAEIPAVIAGSKLFIGNDSGLAHIALKHNVPDGCDNRRRKLWKIFALSGIGQKNLLIS